MSAAPEDRTLRVALLDEIRRAVDFDVHVWLLTDPETEVGVSPLANVPRLDELPRLIALKYATAVNRWTLLDGVALLSDHDATSDWRTFLAARGVVDVASLVFRDRHGCWGFLDLWRMEPHGRFTARDVEVLAGSVPAITSALRTAQARTFASVPNTNPRREPLVLVLSPDLEVRAQTDETERYLQTLLPPEEHRRRAIPAAAYNVAAQLLARESGVDDHAAFARVHLADGVWLSLRAARIGAGGDIAVTIEHTSSAERLAVYARAHALTPRETELVARLASGADTRQVARDLGITENTVQDHLKAIFAKTGAQNRRTLLAQATGR